MEASALTYKGGIGLQSRGPLLRLQSDERLITLVRRGNLTAFEVLVARYQSRLLAFCRHLLGSREDAEDVLQEVMTAAFNAMIADDRPINVRPWLYRIARNRCLNHLRRVQPVGVDSMDVHLSDSGETTADKVYKAEEFRLLVGDIQALPETQRTALVLREMDALSYEQIAEAMETTVPSVKSLLVRARLSLAEAAEARLLSCEQVRIELAEVAEGLLAKASPPVRRHLRSCQRCGAFQTEMRRTSKALAALLPLGPIALLKQLALAHLSHSAGAGSSASGAAGTGAAVGSGAAAGGVFAGAGAGSMVPIGLGALATKAAAGLAAAALVTAGAVDLSHVSHPRSRPHPVQAAAAEVAPSAPVTPAAQAWSPRASEADARRAPVPVSHHHHHADAHHAPATATTKSVPVKLTLTTTKTKLHATQLHKGKAKHAKRSGKTESESIATVMPTATGGSTSTGSPSGDSTSPSSSPTATSPAPGSTPPGSTGDPTASGTPGITPTDPATTPVPTGDPTPTPTPPPTGDPTAPGSTPAGTPAGGTTGATSPTGDPGTSGSSSAGNGSTTPPA